MTEKIIIIGSGPAGFTAAIYMARANLSPLLFEGFQAGGMPGGQLMITGVVENFPGFPEGIDGQKLMEQMRQQVVRVGGRLITEDVVSVDVQKRPFTVVSMSEQEFAAESLIIATGATARRLPLDSEKRLWGRGISACAVCDGALPVFRNKPLAVIGGGDTAIEEAMHLTSYASHVYLIHRRNELRGSKIMQKRLLGHPKITVLWNKTVVEFLGEKQVSTLRLRDTVTAQESELSVAGVFEAIGHLPNTGFLKNQVACDEEGYIITTPGGTKTSVEGIFACGDVQDRIYRQAITAAGSGCMAALDCERWLSGLGH
ncbi:MAG: thioredoxin-disulfide reductase [Chitinivibrionales bacterium]|nr:thioredoxin-disulfide reductase [Chitinivibrionales bacterium]